MDFSEIRVPIPWKNSYFTHPVKIDLNKKLDSKQKTIQTFNIDA